MAASGKRNFTDRFPATKSTRGRSHHDPKPSVSFLQTGQSAKSRFCELDCSEAALGDLNLPATSGQ